MKKITVSLSVYFSAWLNEKDHCEFKGLFFSMAGWENAYGLKALFVCLCMCLFVVVLTWSDGIKVNVWPGIEVSCFWTDQTKSEKKTWTMPLSIRTIHEQLVVRGFRLLQGETGGWEYAKQRQITVRACMRARAGACVFVYVCMCVHADSCVHICVCVCV